MCMINHQGSQYIKYPKLLDRRILTLFFFNTLKLGFNGIFSGFGIMSKNSKLRVKTPRISNSDTDSFIKGKPIGSFIHSFIHFHLDESITLNNSITHTVAQVKYQGDILNFSFSLTSHQYGSTFETHLKSSHSPLSSLLLLTAYPESFLT